MRFASPCLVVMQVGPSHMGDTGGQSFESLEAGRKPADDSCLASAALNMGTQDGEGWIAAEEQCRLAQACLVLKQAYASALGVEKTVCGLKRIVQHLFAVERKSHQTVTHPPETEAGTGRRGVSNQSDGLLEVGFFDGEEVLHLAVQVLRQAQRHARIGHIAPRLEIIDRLPLHSGQLGQLALRESSSLSYRLYIAD